MTKVDLNDIHYQELVHTMHLLENMFQVHVMHHPVVKQTPELKEMAKKTLDCIHEFHQAAGYVSVKR